MKHNKQFLCAVWNLIVSFLIFNIGHLSAQEVIPSGLNVRRAEYPQITSENSAVFRLKAPDAKTVQLRIGPGYDMTRNPEGVWTVTTAPMHPGFHPYSIIIDGVAVSDPATETFFTTGRWTSGIEIPEKDVDFYDIKDVPHGDIRRIYYFSKEKGDWRCLFIYTPPCYEKSREKQYPVLYIQHGAGENETSWSTLGKLDIILDNLIAENKAVPMIVVMSDDYLEENFGRGYNTPSTNAFFDRFARDLIGDIIPFIEKNYRAVSNRKFRAIAGLSMGGGISFRVGLHNPDTFANVGVFSTSAFRGQGDDIFDIEAQVPGLLSDAEKMNEKLDLFYISNGEQDGSFNYTLKTVDTLRSHGVNVELKTFPGTHEWQVWRKTLHDFAQRLFQ